MVEMTKRLSPERLEEIRKATNLDEYYNNDVIMELLAHIDALEEEKKERLKWMDFQADLLEKATTRIKELEKRNDTE